MKALIDGDIVVYRCGFAAEHTTYILFDGESDVPCGLFESAAEMKEFIKQHEIEDYTVERERSVEPLSHALANVKSVMATILAEVGTDDYQVYLSQGKCFRDGIATIKEYKGNRKNAPKPFHYQEIRDYLVNVYHAHVCNSIEADDALALAQGDDTVICSIDKDLLQVPGNHYNWVRDEKILITPEVGLKKLYMQVLTGDGTDNIPGIRGLGPAKARKLLADATTKKEMSTICTQEWDKYLKSERAIDDGFMYHVDDTGDLVKVEYVPWNSDTYHKSSPREIAMEVYQLVKVGGMYAADALHEASEEVPLADTAQGKAA